jgi:hypothetical protein
VFKCKSVGGAHLTVGSTIAQTWHEVSGDANELALGYDGSVWSINAYGQPLQLDC